MNHIKKPLFSNFKFENWINLILVVLVCFYLIYFLGFIRLGSYGGDFFAYWSVGKIADEKGYSQIYDTNNIRSVQIRELGNLGLMAKIDISSFTFSSVPYFSLFILPFQVLSRVNMVNGYWIWTILNLIILIGYLIFFIKKILPENGTTFNYLNLLILMLVSYPVLMNIFAGQVGVLLVVFIGEFIRCAVNKKPILSGLWLGGLLIKPQLLVLIIPIFLFMQNWKVLFGFIVSSGIILTTSLLLSGFTGMKMLFKLWTKYSVGKASNCLEEMINWRMVGLNLNNFLNTSLGWVITASGMVLTVLAVYMLIKLFPTFGSSQWVIYMLGIFSATLAVTWHSYYHMAMILIPFLIYASIYKQLSEKIIALWGILTSIAWFGMLIIDLLVFILTKIYITGYEGMVISFSGFILNLVVFTSLMKIKNNVI